MSFGQPGIDSTVCIPLVIGRKVQADLQRFDVLKKIVKVDSVQLRLKQHETDSLNSIIAEKKKQTDYWKSVHKDDVKIDSTRVGEVGFLKKEIKRQKREKRAIIGGAVVLILLEIFSPH